MLPRIPLLPYDLSPHALVGGGLRRLVQRARAGPRRFGKGKVRVRLFLPRQVSFSNPPLLHHALPRWHKVDLHIIEWESVIHVHVKFNNPGVISSFPIFRGLRGNIPPWGYIYWNPWWSERLGLECVILSYTGIYSAVPGRGYIDPLPFFSAAVQWFEYVFTSQKRMKVQENQNGN